MVPNLIVDEGIGKGFKESRLAGAAIGDFELDGYVGAGSSGGIGAIVDGGWLVTTRVVACCGVEVGRCYG